MGKIRLGIYDRNAGYARGLGGYIRRYRGDGLEVKIFTGCEPLEACLTEGGLDVLLADREAEALCRQHKEIWAAILDEGSPDDKMPSREKSDLPHICKYQSADRLWRNVLLLGGEHLAGTTAADGILRETGLIGVCALSGGYGRTRLGLFMGQVLAAQDRTLFLTLEEFSAVSFFMNGELPEAEISELYYYYSQGGLTAARLQAAVCRRGKLDMIAPVKNPGDLYREGKPYEPAFFKGMAETGGYRWIVLDMGNDLAGKTAVLRECSRIFVLENGCGEEEAAKNLVVPQWEQVRTGAAVSWLEALGLGERIVRCRLPLGPFRYGTAGRELTGPAEDRVRRILEKCGLIPGQEKKTE